MRRSTRSKPVAVFGKRRIPSPLQNLHHRLLDEAIHARLGRRVSHPSIRLRDFHPPHRFRFVGPVQQLLPDSRPVLPQIRLRVDRPSSGRRPRYLCCPSTCRNASFRFCSFTYLLHDLTLCWLGVRCSLTTESDSMSPRPACRASPVGADEKSSLNWIFSRLSLSRYHVLLASPLVRAFSHRFRFGLSVAPPFGDGVPH